MKRWWRGTFGLVAIVAFGFALATLAIGVVAFETTHEALEQQLDHRIAAETQALIDEGDDGPTGIAAAIRRREAARSTASLAYVLVDAAGRRVAGRLDAPVPTKPGYVELLPYTEAGERRIAQSLTTILPSGHRLLVAADRAVIDEIDVTLLRLFAGAFGAMLLLGIAAAWIVGAVTRARLARIDRTALAIIDGDLARRVPVTGSGDEFDGVAATLNRMLDRIGGLMDNLRQVSSDVAHDLRTPLTRLHNRLDEALASDDRAIQLVAIEAAAAEARDLLEIFAALLRIAEVEGMSARAHFTDVSLSALVTDLIEVYRPAMEASGHRLESAIAPGIVVQGDRRLLQRLLSNLLDNAIAHTPVGTKVTVALERTGASVRLRVADDGPGVSPEAAAILFQRFTRADSSRSTTGHGLGLTMVSAIAAAHDGTASVTTDTEFAIMVDIRAT
ncbi:MAG: two-component sensor histidine kinase [Sphingomonas sp.]|nr:two-component sensor histidine kinase [Sphingomonas sp.]MBY0521190.1 HAMP domain-containing histidine kinase [Sphingomonas sp.]